MRYHSAEFKQWTKQVFMLLSAPEPQLALKDLREHFKSKEHVFLVRLTMYYPNLITKDGRISSHSDDLSNTEKPLIDLLFLPKYNAEKLPYGVPNICADDKHILQLTSRKRYAANSGIDVNIAIVKR